MSNHKELRERLRNMADSNITLYSPNGIRSILDLLDRLEAENEELRKDAERYRWLCDASGRDFEAMSAYQITGRMSDAIDAAMKEEG